MKSSIAILDLGSQYTQLIARRIREANVFSEVFKYDIEPEKLKDFKGIILSGGPSSVYSNNAPKINPEIWKLGLPILGICYGMQMMVENLGGKVQPSSHREYGYATLKCLENSIILKNIPLESKVWMSHGDRVSIVPQRIRVIAYTDNTLCAAIDSIENNFYGLQFHPEVYHTEFGKTIINNFIFKVCGCHPDFKLNDFIDEQICQIRELVGERNVICGLSGGVDSAVTAVLLQKAIPNQLKCIFVDTGLLRKGERDQIESVFRPILGDDLIVCDESDIFLHSSVEDIGALCEVEDPEKKRKIIGCLFIKVFETQINKLGFKNAFLAQGTLYPDVIESESVFGGPSHVIKSHHNVGGLPDDMNLSLIEPLKMLFKDEVRELGRKLGLSEEIVMRQPFPGPGLAIRILGRITDSKLKILKEADAILREELDGKTSAWQYFVVLLPVNSVGVMGDCRTYENACVIRAVDSVDGMTANVTKIDFNLLTKISDRIVNEVKGINRVCYDVTSKPPGTIEWE